MNKIRKNELPKNINEYTYPIPQNLKLIENENDVKNEKLESESKPKDKEQLYKKIKPKFKIGRYVYRYLEKPRNALGKEQNTTQHREGDILWDDDPREILQIFTMGGEGEMYRYYLEGLPNVSFTEKQLRPAPTP